MATVTLARSDVFPVGTTVGIYPAQAHRPGLSTPGPPTAQAIATGVVDAAGNLSVTNAGILQGADYTASAQVNGTWQFVRARSTLDVTDRGSAAGTGTTTATSQVVTSPVATTGAFAVGQRISTLAAGVIPPGTYISAVSTMAAGAVTAVAATDVFTRASHGLNVGDSVQFSALTGGAGISTTVPYYVVSVPTSGTFKVSVGPPGSNALDVTTDLTAGTVAGVLVMSDKAITSGAQNLVAEGASAPTTGLGADLVARRGGWRARVAQRRALIGSS